MLLSKETPCKRHQGVRHKKLGRCWKWNRQECRISIVDPSGKHTKNYWENHHAINGTTHYNWGIFNRFLMFTRPGIENDPSRDDSQKKMAIFNSKLLNMVTLW